MAKLRTALTPMRSILILLGVFVAMSFAGNAYKSTNFILALSSGGVLGLISLLIEYRNNLTHEHSEFKVSALIYKIILAVMLLGMLGPRSQEMFFVVSVIGTLLAFWIGLLVIQFGFKQKVRWK
jgi:membrane-associated HD superfamily phosphohydrolase